MAARKQWVFDPHSGGQKIPEVVKVEVAQRIQRVAETHFKGFYIRLAIRFKGQSCYIDAFREYRMRKGGRMPKGWPETRAQFQERMRNTPVHLCRLRYFSDY